MSDQFLSRRGFLAGLLPLTVAPAFSSAKGVETNASLADMTTSPAVDWASVRKVFSLPGDLLFLNNGSLGPSPDTVVQSCIDAWRRLERDPVHQEFGAYSASVGTRNLAGIIGLGRAVDFLTHLDMSRVQARNLALRHRLFEGLRGLNGIQCISPGRDDLAAPLVTIHLLEGRSNTELARSLRDQAGIEVKVLSHGPWHGIRMSTHVYNSEEDIDRFIQSLRATLGASA